MKELIIDGVDVLKCGSFQENYGEYHQGYWEHNDICHEFTNHCSDNPNCKFKKEVKNEYIYER